MSLTASQGVAVITALYAQAEATRKDIESGWYFHESSRQAELGAVRTIEDTQIAVQRDTLDDTLNGLRSEESWTDGAARAEQALSYIRGISAHDTIGGLLKDTGTVTAATVAEGATYVAEQTGKIAQETISILWGALPTAGKVIVVALAVGAVVYFVARASDVVKVARA